MMTLSELLDCVAEFRRRMPEGSRPAPDDLSRDSVLHLSTRTGREVQDAVAAARSAGMRIPMLTVHCTFCGATFEPFWPVIQDDSWYDVHKHGSDKAHTVINGDPVLCALNLNTEVPDEHA